MPEEVLHGPQVVAVFEQVCGEGVPQRMAARRLVDLRRADRSLHRLLDERLAQVMAALLPAARVDGALCGGEHVLPSPRIPGLRVLARERGREVDLAAALLEILAVQPPHAGEVGAQRLGEHVGQHRMPIPRPFALAHQDLRVLEVDVLDAQAQRLHQAQPRAVEQPGHQQRRTMEMGEERRDVRPGEHDRQLRRPPRPHEVRQRVRPSPEDVPVEEDERVERLVLRRSRHLLACGEVGEEGLDVRLAEGVRIRRPVEAQVALDPAGIGLFGAQAVVPQPARQPDELHGIGRGGQRRGRLLHRASLPGVDVSDP